jgi:hypothetical protein
MVFNATFNNILVISLRSGFIDGGNQSTREKPPTCRRQTLSHNVVYLALIEIRTHNISGDRH